MKKLIKKINLRFFQDDANGEFGLTHSDTIGNDSSFNAFWDGQGLFHDVFEHSHEYQDKHFRGQYAMNVGGEMAAMGAMWYYYDALGMDSRLKQNYLYSASSLMRKSTEDLVQEAIREGNCNYGYTLESNVPLQTATENETLEEELQTFCNNVSTYHPKLIETGQASWEAQEIEFGDAYKKSVTQEKIKDLHRYGYRMAEKLVPNNFQNMNTLYNFLSYWNDFCKKHEAETLAGYLRGVEFSIYREGELISWKAKFIPSDGIPAEELEFVGHEMIVKSWE